LSTSTPYIAVLDCDLQHDDAVLPKMLEQLTNKNCDVVIASRYMTPGGVSDWSKRRQFVSLVAKKLADLLVPLRLTDPLSGFFAITRDSFDRVARQLSNQGYKILLDILLSARPQLRVVELPYTFRPRATGQSKLDMLVVWDYLMLLIDKFVGHIIPARFVLFSSVGALGLIVHMVVLTILIRGFDVIFLGAQTTATILAMTFNFFVNNLLTYRDMRLKRFWPVARGLLSFYAVCATGALANVGVASVLFEREYTWWIAGIAGVLVGAVWNYAMTSLFTWRRIHQ
jgi:dolichol-phosphate mannosyltransferase